MEHAESEERPAGRVTLATLVKYLLGDRESILTIASSPQALWLGLVFVFSASLAREYDGEDLLSEPWYLLLPLGASLGSSLLLFSLVQGVAFRHGVRNSFWPSYRSFLALYWLTAPLAWVYAIPVERLLTAGCVARVYNPTSCGPLGLPASVVCPVPPPPAPPLALPGLGQRYSEPMHPTLGTDGVPYLIAQDGLRDLMQQPQ